MYVTYADGNTIPKQVIQTEASPPAQHGKTFPKTSNAHSAQ